MLLELFEKADSFIMAAAEFPVYLLHLLPVLIRELQKVEPGESNMT